LFEIGRLYTDAAKHPYQVNFEKARHYLERGVQANDARAAALLAELYLDGKLVAPDPHEVNALLDMSVASGNATALFRRAMRLEHGDGVARHLPRAMDDYAAAAQAGSADAMLSLCHHYTYGNSCTTIEPHEAVAYAEAALSRGGKAAHAFLGRFYEHGFGVEVSATRAEEYYRAAAIAHDALGHVGLARLGMRRTGGQRDAAEIRRHVAAACASNNHAAKTAAEVILRQLETSERLATVPGTVTLEDIASGSVDAPVSLVLCISMADAACALFERTVLPALTSRFIEPGYVRLLVREGNAEAAGAWAVVRTAERTTRLSVLRRLLAAQAQWKGEQDQVTAFATALADLDFDAQRVSRALASLDVISRIQYMGGQVAGSFGVAKVPTIFVNGLKLMRPDLARLEAAILLAEPPEVAVSLNGASTLQLPGS
jgi:TPR repeat protein